MTALRGAVPPPAGSICTGIWGQSCPAGGRKICDANGWITSINAANCGITGAIPAAISGLSFLVSFSAAGNSISGFPAEFSSLSRLTKLDLSNNKIAQGYPEGLASARALKTLDLSNNQITGSLPTAADKYSDTLIAFKVGANKLTGSLPSRLFSLSILQDLNVSRNQITGTVPAPSTEVPMTKIDVSNNLISGMGSLAAFKSLQNLYAQNNQISSPLPEIGSINTFMNLFLQNNKFSGGIPNSWQNLDGVNYIDISNNQLSGKIPSFVFDSTVLSSISSFDMQGNFLYGDVPGSACSDTYFPYTLSGNCFSYLEDFSCMAEAMSDAATCKAMCGKACVPTVAGVDLTSAPLGGCQKCSTQGIGYFFDASSGTVSYQEQGSPPSSRGAGSRNIQKYLTVGPSKGGSIVGTSPAETWEACCTVCAKTQGCSYWHFYPPGNVPSDKDWIPGTECYLLKNSPPQAMLPALQPVDTTIPISHVGGLCNPNVKVVDDPHFIGARGTRFDFSGDLGKSFCLLSDASIHINVLIEGYLDSRLEAATKIVEGKAVRSWIKEAAIMWKTPSGASVSIQLAARPGLVNDSLAHTFLKQVTVNGIPTALPKVGKESSISTGVVLAFKGVQQKGSFQMAVYELHLGDDVVLGVHLRPAHHKLQTADDSHVHINLHLLKIDPTDEVHGILGQTFRGDADREQRAREYAEIVKLLKSPISADGDTGKGFLDGTPRDYATSRLSAPDCVFAHRAWNTQVSNESSGNMMMTFAGFSH